ncbi:MAG: aminotransferase class V-fold PLP-dependent enzyme [Acidobacteria bacterium]|nr:aminotransferase class V-fold PLP-dependent enzyme [Acidobacteriota bacterium]MXZ39627.1 aminotransferase class V-fold PLP-dependent enzyme [Holophagales bacterium]MYF05744.1 aminotransferase class V-fold PLP-dependent enzyme [Holophagales bacterium]MYJ26091.1 aminotransferase class V-fold PLP-dependent enzyme [Holophagales bacterium]
MLPCQRYRFQLPPHLHYLNCAYMAPLAREVEEAGLRGMARRRDPSKITATDFFAETDALRERFARLIGSSDPQRVAIIPAVSYGIATAARNVPVESGQNIVILGEQFPSNVYVWMRKAEENGAELRVVERSAKGRPSPGASWNRRLLRAIDRRTAVVATPVVHWADGTRFNVAAIGRRARSVGAAFVIDGTQSIGALPFDVKKVAPDALVVAGYKTLFGPYQSGLAWFGERFDDGVPLEEPWAAREGSDRFVAGRIEYVESYRPGALRYDVGERSNQIQVPMLNAALDMVLEWGPERVQEYCENLLEPFEEVFREAGFELEDRAWRGAHLFGLRSVRGLDADKAAATLRRAGIFVSVRGEAIRVAPQVYNDRADLDALAATLQSF